MRRRSARILFFWGGLASESVLFCHSYQNPRLSNLELLQFSSTRTKGISLTALNAGFTEHSTSTRATHENWASKVNSSHLSMADLQKSGFGLLFALTVLTGLSTETSPIGSGLQVEDTIPLKAVSNVFDAAMPTSSTDLVAVALGEAVAGVIGASFSAIPKVFTIKDRRQLVTGVVADSDYFIAQAGLAPTFGAFGLSPLLASLSSVVVASVPSVLVKLGSRQRELREFEEKSLEGLLVDQQNRRSGTQRIFGIDNFLKRGVERETSQNRIDPNELIPVSNYTIDTVEIFSDVTRWLAYNVLKTDYAESGFLSLTSADPGLSGAVLGFIAAVASLVYADVLYGIFQYGPRPKQLEVQNRRPIDWLTYYSTNSFSTAALFGIYEFSQRPISRYIQGVLAGGFDGCLGSASFEACFDTYIDANAPGPSSEAQVRALVTNLVMVQQRIADIAVDTTADDIETLVRAWCVSAYSYIQSIF